MRFKKDITFIYMDSAEKAIYQPLYQEAVKRGYKVKLTKNEYEKCEIGFYCQHVNFPQYSKFSVVMLHDIIQQYGNWPDIWFREPWNKYDVGILPSERWVENWNQCSQWFYARPRKGMYMIGWPKADVAAHIQKSIYKEEFYKEHNLDITKRTVLYAPAWENDGKQDEFVQAMIKLDVNILIKQWDADPIKFPKIVKNIQEMYNLHKNNPRVTILPPQTNIFEAIAVSDILVSEESSTMCEAVMMGVPAVSVSNWLIPDVTPSRYPSCDYDFVKKTMKENLTECICEMLSNYEQYQKDAFEYSRVNFSNVGKASSMIMDIVDDYVNGNTYKYEALKPQQKKALPFKKWCKFTWESAKREMYYNYCQRNCFLACIWSIAKKVKQFCNR